MSDSASHSQYRWLRGSGLFDRDAKEITFGVCPNCAQPLVATGIYKKGLRVRARLFCSICCHVASATFYLAREEAD